MTWRVLSVLLKREVTWRLSFSSLKTTVVQEISPESLVLTETGVEEVT